ncbi:hypothetical protein NKDENANG_03690 [Candidatus Entotheonellaceae bacterium PAL068K]
MPGIVVHMEFVRLAMTLECGLGDRGIFWQRTTVLSAKQPEQRATEVRGKVDRGNGLALGELISQGHDPAAIAIDGGIAGELTGG